MDAEMQLLSNAATWWLYSHPAGTNTCADCHATGPVYRYPGGGGVTDYCAPCLRNEFTKREPRAKTPRCAACGEPMSVIEDGQTTHPGC